MPWGIKFDGSRFSRRFIGNKASRSLHQFLDKIPVDNLIYVVENKRDLASFFTQEQLHQFRANTKVPQEFLEAFDDNEVYTWIPQEYLSLFKSIPGGEDWARSQIGFLRQLLMPS